MIVQPSPPYQPPPMHSSTLHSAPMQSSTMQSSTMHSAAVHVTQHLYAVAVHEPGEKPQYLRSYDTSELPLFTDRTAQASLTTSKVVAMLDCTELQEWYPHARVVTFIAERVDEVSG